MHVVAHYEAERRELRRKLLHAWTSAAFSRAEKLPPLDQVLDPGAQRAESPEAIEESFVELEAELEQAMRARDGGS